MTIGYLLVTIAVLVSNVSAIPHTFSMMIGSAFNVHAVFGGMIGGAFSYGIKRAVNSSGSGIMALVTDYFNVLGPDGTFMHTGQGSAQITVQAEIMTAGVVWVQEAASAALPNGIGGMIIALALLFHGNHPA